MQVIMMEERARLEHFRLVEKHHAEAFKLNENLRKRRDQLAYRQKAELERDKQAKKEVEAREKVEQKKAPKQEKPVKK